jgi:peptidoglycan/LPS O-acetylase OafA/YrhL
VATLIIIYMPFIARGSIAHFGATVIGSTLLCALLYFSIDRPLQAVRRLIKQVSHADVARQDQTLTQTLEIHPT